MALPIDLNADLGEDDTPEGIARDVGILALVTRCNIACGGHAGDRESMRRTLRAAAAHGVQCGAHPSYPDRAGFGRRSHGIAGAALRDSLMAQVTDLRAIAAEEGVTLTHLKPHGALYNEAAVSDDLADIVADVTLSCLPNAMLIGPPDCCLAAAADARGMPYMAEGFVDRGYRSDGTLVPRDQAGAMVEPVAARVAQALAIVQGRAVPCPQGGGVMVRSETLCLHSDSPSALETAQAVRAALERMSDG